MDRRSQKTKNEIQKTTLELLKKKNLTDLSVSEICNRANIGRSTFYLHFSDLNDLINQIEEKKMSEIFQICLEFRQSHATEICIEVAKYVKKNKSILKTLLTKTNQHFQNKIRLQCKTIFQTYYHLPETPSFSKYYFAFITQGAISVFSEWILDDCCIEEDELVRNFMKCLENEISKKQ